MTSADVRLGEDTVIREEKGTEKDSSRAYHLRVLARTLPSADRADEQTIFATAFVKELETSSPEAAYLRAVEVLNAFRQVDVRYREGHLDWSPPYR